MNIALMAVDSDYPNLALMKISSCKCGWQFCPMAVSAQSSGKWLRYSSRTIMIRLLCGMESRKVKTWQNWNNY